MFRKMSHKAPPYWMYGMHPVAAALANPRRTCLQLLATEQALQTLTALLQDYPYKHPAQQRLTLERLTLAKITAKQTIDKLHKPNTTHQSLSLKCNPLPTPPLAQLIEDLRTKKTTRLVMLDRVQDPHNIGAILRSTRFFQAQALLLAKGHAPQENASIAKAACGALEHIPILHTNLAQALTTLGKKGWSRIAFDAQPQENNSTENNSSENNRSENNIAEHNIMNAEHQVLVFGAEGTGLRRLVLEHCDLITRIEGGNDHTESLNVSNAVAVALSFAHAREEQTNDRKNRQKNL